MRPTLGVLITYFNEQELLRECLDSLLNQREGPEEILIYDDASVDPAGAHVPRGNCIRIIRGDVNKGPGHGRNVLLRASQSDYIHFHDADDLFHPDWCQRVRDAVEETGADVVFTEVSSRGEGGLQCKRVMGLDRLVSEGDLIRFCIRGAILTSAGTYRRSAVSAIGGYREALWQAEDFDFHIRLAASNPRYTLITEPLITRLRVGRSKNQAEVWGCALEAISFMAQELPRQYRPDLAERAAGAGSILFQLGLRVKARKAFRLANEMGPPTWRAREPLYQQIAQHLGPEWAEWAGWAWRRLVPSRVRGIVQPRQ